MTINPSGWRPSAPTEAGGEGGSTFTGNRALMLEEALIFEIGTLETTGVDLPEPTAGPNRLGGLARSEPIGLPGLSEPETVRHYTRLSRQNIYCAAQRIASVKTRRAAAQNFYSFDSNRHDAIP